MIACALPLLLLASVAAADTAPPPSPAPDVRETDALYDVDGRGALIVAVGAHGAIFRLEPGRRVRLPSPTRRTLRYVSVREGAIVIADDRHQYETTDGGAHWRRGPEGALPPSRPSAFGHVLDFFREGWPPRVMAHHGCDVWPLVLDRDPSPAYRPANGGGYAMHGLWARDEHQAVVVGEHGAAYRTVDGGRTWQRMP